MKRKFKMETIDKVFLSITIAVVILAVIGIFVLKGIITPNEAGERAIQGKWTPYKSLNSSKDIITDIEIKEEEIVVHTLFTIEIFDDYYITFDRKNGQEIAKITTSDYKINMVFDNSLNDTSAFIFITNKRKKKLNKSNDVSEYISYALYKKDN